MDTRHSFDGSGTTAASYAAVPLNWATDHQPINWWKTVGQGALGISVVNTHASLTMKVKLKATNYSADGKTPLNTDPTSWPTVIAEATIDPATAAELLIEVNVAHHLFYAVIVIDGSGHATYKVYGGQKMVR